jgi:N-formylglutamate deformylase
LVDETFARYGVAVIVDCHSMPSAAAAPDIVLGDRYGSAASQVLVRTAEKALAAVGFRTVRNVPYAGGYTTSLYGQPGCGLHALQVEVNRALYLDEERIVRSHAFTSTARRIAEAFAAIVTLDPAILRPDKGLGVAAE